MIRTLLLLGTACLVAAPVPAETLAQAIEAAYASNPTLAAAGARQESLAETIEQARSAGRLAASADAAGGYDRFDYGKGGGATVSAELPIWTGGRVKSAVRAARSDVAAGEEGLRDTRAVVLEGVVAAYADLLYDQEAVAIATADLALLQHQIAEAQARFKLGTSTLTDVARLQAQFAGAQATLADARALAASDRAAYRATVGHDPDTLTAPSAAPATLPATLDEARSLALASNPLYRQSQQITQASSARIDAAHANGAPSAGLSGAYGYNGRFAGTGDRFYNQAASGGLTLHVPILTGGLVASQVRQARSDYRAAQFDRDAAERDAIRSADAAWAALVRAQGQASANAAGVAAADIALKGVRAEYAFALRSTLDILVADESLRAAQLALARNRSDLLIAQAALLRAIGGLDRDAFAEPQPR
ncbi:TolC family protein [Sphingomonas sp. BIUV-7]|uniref:TolC family protein n=1 Tax=Sphingomonas natans TaxID=3063330 RepID=A0ABT8Y5H0_9SPHN|nr:TolC family protein [Sphingomonas sp. BIUV-7]MDO6413568.1 TolC family protein [Sphingomonas sp. BIUV-7]